MSDKKLRVIPIIEPHWEHDHYPAGSGIRYTPFIDNQIVADSYGGKMSHAKNIWENSVVETTVTNRIIDYSYTRYAISLSLETNYSSLEYIPELAIIGLSPIVEYVNNTLVSDYSDYGGVLEISGSGGDYSWRVVKSLQTFEEGNESDRERFIESNYAPGQSTLINMIEMLDGSGNFNWAVISEFAEELQPDEGFVFIFTLSNLPRGHNCSEFPPGISIYFGPNLKYGLHFPLGGIPTLSQQINQNNTITRTIISQCNPAFFDGGIQSDKIYSIMVRVIPIVGGNKESRPPQKSFIYDKDGNVIYTCQHKKAIVITPLSSNNATRMMYTQQESTESNWVYAPLGQTAEDQPTIQQLPNSPAFAVTGSGPVAIFGIAKVRYITEGQVSSPVFDSPYVPQNNISLETVFSLPGNPPEFYLDSSSVQTELSGYSSYSTQMPSGESYQFCRYFWTTTLTSSEDGIYSPYLHRVNVILTPQRESVSGSSGITIEAEDIQSLSVSLSTTECSASVTLLNTRADGLPLQRDDVGIGKYAELSGAHYMAIDGGWKIVSGIQSEEVTWDDRMQRLFSGRFSNPSFSLTNVANATVSLSGVDLSVILRETPAINLPIYDGWCAIRAILDLATRAGFPTEQVVAYQNPRIYEDSIYLESFLTPECYQDSCDHVLPSSGFMESPIYMFNAGAYFWENINTIGEFLGAWVFVNNWGSLVVVWPQLITAWQRYNPGTYQNGIYYPTTTDIYGGLKFLENFNFYPVETDVNAYNQYWNLTFNVNTDHIRNVVSVGGLEWNPQYSQPVYVTIKDYKSITDPTAYNYIGIKRPYVKTDPHLNTFRAVYVDAYYTFLKLCRPIYTISFELVGNPDLFPYDIIKVFDPTNRTRIGANGSYWRIVSVNHTFEASSKQFTTSIEAEWVDPAYVYFPMW